MKLPLAVQHRTPGVSFAPGQEDIRCMDMHVEVCTHINISIGGMAVGFVPFPPWPHWAFWRPDVLSCGALSLDTSCALSCKALA